MIETQNTPTPSIISLDDDLAMHAVYDQIAQRLNAHHISFDTIEDAILHLKTVSTAPIIFIIDRLLPDGDGLDFAVFARKQIPELNKTHFLLVSGAKTEIHDPRLITGRIEHFFDKPFKMADLNALIGDLLSQDISGVPTIDDAFINAAFADDLLRLSIELLHASQSNNADPMRILHSIHGIAGMLEQDHLRSNTARLMNLTGALTKTEYLPMILHIVQQCEEVAHGLTDGQQPTQTKVAL